MSILEQTNSYNRTEKYKVISTQKVIDYFCNKGYEVTAITKTNPIKKEKQGYQKHMVRLANPNLKLKNVDDSRPELVIVNSHDGSTALKLYIGVYRMVCANGLVVGKTYTGQSIRHIGEVYKKLDQAQEYIHEKLPMVASTIEQWMNYHCTRDEISQLVHGIVPFIVPKHTVQTQGYTLTKAHRTEDESNALWHVYNRIQENALRGGVEYTIEQKNELGQPHYSQRKTRHIISLDRQLKVNRKLWDLSERLVA